MSDSLVFGDVIQMRDVAGGASLTITPRMPPPYQVEPFPLQAQTLSLERAQAQPSRLLLPRHRVVPFIGREQQLHDLTEWTQGAAMAVRLVHAAGGQGKTRLADEFATRCAGEGWAVWRVVHSPTSPCTSPWLSSYHRRSGENCCCCHTLADVLDGLSRVDEATEIRRLLDGAGRR